MSREQSFRLSTPHGDLHGVVQLPSGPGPHPVAVICHGFKGFMEWGFFPPLADLLVNRGYAAVRFNLTGTGMLPGDELVTRPEAFHRALFTNDVADLAQILDSVGGDIGGDTVDPERIGLIGHSRGGGASVLVAALPRWRDRLRALVTWAGVSTFQRFRDYEDTWRENGQLPIVNGRTGQELSLGLEVLEDLHTNAQTLDILAAAEKRRAPWLIAHGEDDPTVDVQEARDLAERASDPVELLALPGADHTFGARHPFAGPTPHLTQILNATQTWLRRHCW